MKKISDFKIFINKILSLIPTCLYPILLELLYLKEMGKFFSVNSPKKFTEKIQWLKLNENNEIKTYLSDKLSAKDFIQKEIPTLKYAKVLQIAQKFEDINFENLPNKFVIKTNHACKTNTFITDQKQLSEEYKKELNQLYTKYLKLNYAFVNGLELQYNKIKPLIFVEEYLENNKPYPVNQFEVYCFNGEPKYIVDTSFFQNKEGNYRKKNITYNTDGIKQDFYIGFKSLYENTDTKITFSQNMLKYSKILASKFKFARIDFYEINNELYFSEITFTPLSGFIEFIPEEYDLVLGEKLDLK